MYLYKPIANNHEDALEMFSYWCETLAYDMRANKIINSNRRIFIVSVSVRGELFIDYYLYRKPNKYPSKFGGWKDVDLPEKQNYSIWSVIWI